MILVTDDDPVSLRVLSETLKNARYSFVTAEDGGKAWELLQQSPEKFSLVVADRVMPGLHGLELFAKMRKHIVLKDIPLILLTGAAEKEDVVEAVQAGVADFLYKPLDADLLLAVVKRVLK